MTMNQDFSDSLAGKNTTTVFFIN